MTTPNQFDKFLKKHTKPGTPEDCANVIADLDCIQRNVPLHEYCESCREYDRVLQLWNTATDTH